jgi:peptidyl-prolyl cis-trans isomerase SurA
MNRFFLSLTLLLTGFVAQAQKEDPVLFTCGGTNVHVSEFEYIYTKTNGKNADFSRASLQEYLDLYIRFKLKVERAKAMKLDTIPSLREELQSYRRQLSDSYLINREVTDRLVREVYERSAQDVEVHHIFFALSPEASPADTLAAYRKALAAKKQLDSGAEDFASLARTVSEDKSTAPNGGKIGFLNVLFPNGFYGLENAAYTLPLLKVSEPIRSPAGYHLLQVGARRPARGEIEIAHIMLRKDLWEGDPDKLKQQIYSHHQQLLDGKRFETLCSEVSQDSRTLEKGGYLGFFGINRYEQAFEDTAFAIRQDGDFSWPVESSIGWHIIKRISKKEFPSFEIARLQFENQIRQDGRFELARKAMIEQIKKANGFKENTALLDKMAKILNDTFYTFRWKAPAGGQKEVLFSLSSRRYTMEEFNTFLAGASRERMQLSETPFRGALQTLYLQFVESACMQFEEGQLEARYPDFKALLREYQEGILLFEATRIEVWDKASQDSAGLERFFATIPGKYQWNERAEVTKYFVDAFNAGVLESVRNAAATKSKAEMLEAFNTKEKTIIARAEESFLERDKSQEALEIRQWTAGEVTAIKADRGSGQFYFCKVENVIPAQPKKLSEARGYIVADYQDYLEQEWVEALRAKYPVKVDQNVFEKMIRQK